MAITLNKLYPGKLDHNFLHSLLESYTDTDEHMLQGAAVGEDATVLEFGDRYLVLKTDPVTFTTQHIGHYIVHINANDVLCMGATPRWFLATILVPERSEKSLVREIFKQISDVCRQEHIVYCGGHTEVTPGIDRPIVVGHMMGEASKDELLLKRHVKQGDHLILANAVPIEGTTILAREHEKELTRHFSKEFVQRCENFLFDPGISIRNAAELARSTATVHALHDPTEGGLATGIYEMVKIADLGVLIDMDKIPVLAEGKLICDYFDIDPLGCISSGSLLLAVPPKSVEPLLAVYKEHGMDAADIGRVLPKDEGHVLVEGENKRKLPIYYQDELLRAN